MKTLNNAFLVGSMLAAGFAVTGCTAFVSPTTSTCIGDADDGVACTVAVCPAGGGEYQHIPNDALCASGQMCHATNGCVARDPGCPASCADAFACTVDSCVSGSCRHTANDDACPGDAVCRANEADAPSGCYTPPTDEGCETNADCNDGVSCTANRCMSGTCVFSDACPSGQRCDAATDACVDETLPPPPDRFCADGQLIGERIRLSLTGMSGIRSFAGRAITSANAGTILWNFYGTPNTFAPGSTVEMPVVGGTINVHFNDGGAIAFDSRMANLQSISTATDDVTGEARGITAEVYRGGRWVPLPVGFLHFGWDTNPSSRWGESDDPLVPTGERIGRLLLNTDCETQYTVYEATTGRYRAAR
ncbi:hypothetical protein EDM68_04085 [Candidatus Uhrbacteria bacterium]|nr:MAG: hypothetical protein EDM68_04085 [Candidatus Uhrbacteria bacterium]